MTEPTPTTLDDKLPKITILVSHLVPTYGLETVVLSVLRLLDKNFDIRTVCIGGSEADLEKAHHVSLLGEPLRGMKRIFSIWRLWKFARHDESDHIILAGLWVAIPWLLVSGRKARKSIVWEHTLLNAKLPKSLKLRVLAFFARHLYPRARRVVAVSEPVARDMSKIAPKANIYTINNPFPESKKEANRAVDGDLAFPQGRGRSLITIGSLTAIKSQHLAIRVLPLLATDIVLVVVGSGPQRATLEKLAEDLGVSHRVSFKGFREPPDVRRLLMAADVLVHCSVAETFGLVYLEAAEVGLPVISTRSDVADYMIPKYVRGQVCERTPESLATAITTVLNRAEDIEASRLAAEHRNRAFSASTVQAQWKALLTETSEQSLSDRCMQ